MTNWPWPLDGVQDWFESFWNWISTAAVNAVSVVSNWIWGAIYWVRDRISEGWNWLGNQVWGFVSWLSGQVSSGLNYLGNQVWGFVTWLGGQVSSGFNWLSNQVINGLASARDFFSNGLSWLGGQVSSGLSTLGSSISGLLGQARDAIMGGLSNLWTAINTTVGNVSKAVTGAVTGLWDSLTGLAGDLLRGVTEALGSGLQAFWDWLLKHLTWLSQMIMGAVNSVIAAVQGFIMDLGRRFIDTLTGIFTPGSPDKQLETTMAVMVETMNTRVVDEIKKMYKSPPEAGAVLATAGSVATLLGVGILSVKVLAASADAAHPTKDIGFKDVAETMIASTGARLMMSSLLTAPADVGLLTPLRYAYNRMFTPIVPGSGDLVRMVVREAFDPKMVIAAPAEFADAMMDHGFSTVWSNRYWTAHFEPIALRQAYENLWRGYWKKEQFIYALHIADIHPMWREDIYAVAFGAPSARELGYGFDVGEYSVEDIAKFRRWGGLAPEDAEKAARSMVAYRTEAEREALRREALADFEAWLDDESQLRVNLKAIGGRDEVVDLWVARAEFRRARDFILDMVKVSVDLHYKGHINDQGLDQDLIELGITPEGRSKIMAEAKARRLKAVVAEKIAKKKVMPESRVRQARDLGLISDPEYMRRLLDHDWTEEDARLDLAIELTPKPVTIEEIERRKRTVTSKRNRATRRYDLTLARVQDQIDLTSAQLDDTRVTMEESLDIIDAQIAVIDEELEVATPERAVTLAARRVVLVQRRELQVTRWETRIRTLTEQHKNLLETRDLVTRQRDEELSEYDAELKLLEVAG